MRLVGIESLKAGQTLAMPVSTSSGKVVLNAGVVLTEGYVEKIKKLSIHKVYIEDVRFSDIELNEPLDVKTMHKAIHVIKESYVKVHKGMDIDEYQIKDIAKGIVEHVKSTRDKGASILSIKAIDDYIIEHSLNVAILSAFIGSKMTFNFNQLCDLVTGALIHDLGRENTREEKPEHVQKGFDAMRRCRGLSLHSSIVCYEHHENFNGTGYPRKLKGTAISDYSRVMRVADVYDNLLHGYDRNNVSVMPYQAYESLMVFSGNILDPFIVELFKDAIIFYPNGCSVLLSSGLTGIVVRQNIGNPMRPVVRVYNDNSILGEIDLLKSMALSIKDIIVS